MPYMLSACSTDFRRLNHGIRPEYNTTCQYAYVHVSDYELDYDDDILAPDHPPPARFR